MSSTADTPATRRTGPFALVLLAMSCVIATPSPTRAQASPPMATPTASGPAADPIAAAVVEYQASGIARTVVTGNFVSFPHGHTQPTLTCTVLRACVIELQAGEIVLSRIAGDTERWEVTPAPAGQDGRTVLIVVKPRDCDITTNLVLATDRRLYDLTLDSPPCRERSTNPQQSYVRHVRFYYPDETVAQWAKPMEATPVRIMPDVLTLNFDYRVRKDKKFPWSPSQVFDDGVRVYIKLPKEAKNTEAPVLFVLEEDGGKTLVNYNVVAGDTYVTDRLFGRAALVTGVGGKEQKAVIERKGGSQ